MADRKLNTAEAVNDIDSLLGVKGASIGRITKKALLSVLLGGGGTLPDSTNADADTLLTCGIYRVVNGTNLPDGAYTYGHLIVIGEYRKLQIYIPYGDTNDNLRSSLYVRTRLSDSWFNWIKFQGTFL